MFLAAATATAAVAALSVAAATGSAATGSAATGSAAASVSAAASARRVLPAYLPMWAVLTPDGGSAAADLGPAPAQAPASARVYLAGRDPRGLSAFAAAVSAPHSRLFRRYLTPAQVRRQFGPTRTQVAAVESWLTAAGMQVTGATAQYIAVTGTASEAAAAFGAGWHSYQVAGRTQQAPPPGAQLTAPAPVSSAVLTVVPAETGLPGSSGTAAAAAPATAVAAPATAARLCSQYFGQNLATGLPDAYGRPVPYGGCGYTPQQVRSAYGVPARLTGQGVTVAVVHPSDQPTAAQDLATFGARHGEPLHPGQFTQILPAGLSASCPDGIQAGSHVLANEETADVETVHAMAPDANIVYLGAKCDDDLGALSDLDALTQIVDQRLATIVSNSWSTGLTSPGQAAAYEQVFQQGAAEGIGFYFSSGDYGDGSTRSVTHQPQLNYPTSDPWVTSVGGTTLAIDPHDGYQWETGWGDSAVGLTADGTAWANLPGTFQMGAGGGTSIAFSQPAYQRGVVPAALSHAHGSVNPMRVIPDIAADADPLTGVLIGQTLSRAPGQPASYGEGAFGGTSASAPLIAGIQADAEQAAGVAIGFANPAIYARYGSPAYHDITDDPLGPGVHLAAAVPTPATVAPQLYTFGLDQGLAATPGYDDVTGVGTPAPAYYTAYRGS